MKHDGCNLIIYTFNNNENKLKLPKVIFFCVEKFLILGKIQL